MSFQVHINTVLCQSSIMRRPPTRSTKDQSTDQMPVPKNKRELQAFLGTINYLGKFSPSTLEVCEPLQKLTSSKMTWTWNVSYQQLLDKAKSLIKAEVCMKSYDDTKPLYLETDASGIGLRAAILQLCNNTD